MAFQVFACVPHKHLQLSSLWNIPSAQPGKILVSVCPGTGRLHHSSVHVLPTSHDGLLISVFEYSPLNTAELNFTVFPSLRFHHVQTLVSPVSESFHSFPVSFPEGYKPVQSSHRYYIIDPPHCIISSEMIAYSLISERTAM